MNCSEISLVGYFILQGRIFKVYQWKVNDGHLKTHVLVLYDYDMVVENRLDRHINFYFSWLFWYGVACFGQPLVWFDKLIENPCKFKIE